MEVFLEQLSKAVDALDGEAFTDAFSEWISHAVPNDNIVLLAYFQDRNPEILRAHAKSPELHENLEHGYLNGAYLLDPFHDLHLRQVESSVYRMIDIAPDQFSRNQYFIEYYAKTTMIDEIAFVCYPNPGVSLHLCLGRDGTSNRKFTVRELKDAKAVMPVVSSMLNRQWSDLNTTGSFDEGEAIKKFVELAQSTHGVSLTPRQAEIVFLILKGHSSTSISYKLDISYQTVKVFRRQVYKKCQISSQAELFSMFVPLIMN